MKTVKERYTERTIKLIENNRVIVLAKPMWKDSPDKWYLGQHTVIQAGPDSIHWTSRPGAMHIFNLELAFALAEIFGCKVYSYKAI